MREYICPKVQFIELSKTDVLTASVGYGINMPSISFQQKTLSYNEDYSLKTFSNSINSDSSVSGIESNFK